MSDDALLDDDEWDIEKAIKDIKSRKRCYSHSHDELNCGSQTNADCFDVSEFVETEYSLDDTLEDDQTQSLTESQKQFNTFWPKVTEEISNLNQHDLHHQELPVARVKRIMKLDEDKSDKMFLSADAPVLLSKAAEIFITELTLHAWIQAEDKRKITLQKSDMATTIAKYGQFDFLLDFVSRDGFEPTKSKESDNDNCMIFSPDKKIIPIAPCQMDEGLSGNMVTAKSSPPVSITQLTSATQQPILIVDAGGQVVQTISNNAQVVKTEPYEQHQQQQQQSVEGMQTILPSSSPSSLIESMPLFYIGRAFSSYEDICAAKEQYEKQNKINIVKRTSRLLTCPSFLRNIKNANDELVYSEIRYGCVHGGNYRSHRETKSSDLNIASEPNTINGKKRRKTSTYKWQCPFMMVLYLSKDCQTLIVRKFLEDHNHSCHSSIFDQLPQQRRLDAETLEETKMLLALNVDKKKVQQHLYSKGKMVTVKYLHNLMRTINVDRNGQPYLVSKGKMDITKGLENLLSDKVEKSDSFEDVLALMMNHQDLSFEILIGNEGICQGIFFQTESMKLKFDTYSEMILVDTTYKLIELSMPIYVILCLDDNGETEVVALALAQYENMETLSWVAESFQKYNPNFLKIKWIMADKETMGREVLLDHFPNAELLISQLFHTLRSFKREVTTKKMDISVEERDFSIEIIQSIVFSEDKITCDSSIALLKEMAPKNVVNYFTKNWEPFMNDWVRGLQIRSLHFDQSTNRIDIFRGKLKSLIKKYSSMTQFFTDLMTVIRHYECERNHRTINTLIKRPTNMVKNKDLAAYGKLLTPYAHRKVMEQMEPTPTHPTRQVLTFSPFLTSSPLMEPIFYIGRAFTSYEDLCVAKEMYEKQNEMELVKKRSRRLKGYHRNTKNAHEELIYSEISYSCIHGGTYKGKKFSELEDSLEPEFCNEKKRKLSSHKFECPFKIDLYLSKDGQTLIVFNLEEDHNHVCPSSINDQLPLQGQLDAETAEEERMLLSLNVDDKKVQQHLHSKGKSLTTEDLQNLLKNDFEGNDSFEEISAVIENNVIDSFEDILDLMENNHDLCFEKFVNNKNVCQGIYFQTVAMKLLFEAYNEIICIDATQKLHENSMPLYVIQCVDGNGETEVIALALAEFENEETLSWIADTFINNNPNFIKVKFIMADNSMLKREVLLNHFPNADLLICLFQILQTFKKEVTTTKMDISAEERRFSLEIVQNIVFAKDKVTCNSNITLLVEMAPKEVVDYFTEMWKSIKKEWIRCLKSQTLDFYRSRGNRAEIFYGELKSLIKSYSSISNFFIDLITSIKDYECERNYREMITSNKHSINVGQQKDLQAYEKQLTPYAFKIIKEQIEQMRVVNFVKEEPIENAVIIKCSFHGELCVTANECPCRYKSAMFLPCRHILKARQQLGLSIFDEDLCDERWCMSFYTQNLQILYKVTMEDAKNFKI